MQNQKNSDLVTIQDGGVVTSSLQVSQVFQMRHSDVLRAIRNLDCSEDFQERNFAFKFYISELGNKVKKNNPMFHMTKDGFTFLVMGFTGKKAGRFKEAYINAFNQMEQYINNHHSFETPKIDLEWKINQLTKERDEWKKMYFDKDALIGQSLLFLREMNKAIDSERSKRRRLEEKLKKIKEMA